MDVFFGERLSLFQFLPLPDPKILRRSADEGARHPVLVPMDNLAAGEDQGRQAVDARAFMENGLCVLGCQGLDAAAAQTDPIARGRAGLNDDVVDARLGQEQRMAVQAPLPISAIASSDPTPMMMPSVVSAERKALRRRERIAVEVVRARNRRSPRGVSR